MVSGGSQPYQDALFYHDLLTLTPRYTYAEVLAWYKGNEQKATRAWS